MEEVILCETKLTFPETIAFINMKRGVALWGKK